MGELKAGQRVNAAGQVVEEVDGRWVPAKESDTKTEAKTRPSAPAPTVRVEDDKNDDEEE
jgi:hypothetical protein